jgi:chitodextrinase
MMVDYVRMYSYPESVDTEAPTAPLSLSGVSTSPSVNLSWGPSTDNYSVKEYEVYQGDSLVGTTIWHKYFVDNLQPLTSYSFKVRAKDYSGNYSAFATTQATTIGASVPLVNPAFEADGPTQAPTGWSEALTTTASYTEGGGRSGNKLVHYSATKFKVSTFQTIIGLENGTYTLSAYYMGGGGNVQMIGKNFGGTAQNISLGTATNVWTQKKLENIVVSNGQITVEFLSDFSTNRNGGWLFIDDVSLSKTSTATQTAAIASSGIQERLPRPSGTTTPFPNPFTNKVTIPVNVTQRGFVEVKIYNASGALVRNLSSRELEAGNHQFVWDGNGADGTASKQGVYIYKVTANGETYSGKLIKEK